MTFLRSGIGEIYTNLAFLVQVYIYIYIYIYIYTKQPISTHDSSNDVFSAKKCLLWGNDNNELFGGLYSAAPKMPKIQPQ